MVPSLPRHRCADLFRLCSRVLAFSLQNNDKTLEACLSTNSDDSNVGLWSLPDKRQKSSRLLAKGATSFHLERLLSRCNVVILVLEAFGEAVETQVGKCASNQCPASDDAG